MTVLVATPQYLARYGAPAAPEDLNRFRSVVFVERGSVQPWSFGSGQEAKHVIPTGVFRTSDIEQMRMGVLEHLRITQAPAWLFAAELREGAVVRLLVTPFERTVPILAVRPATRRVSADCGHTYTSSRAISRRTDLYFSPNLYLSIMKEQRNSRSHGEGLSWDAGSTSMAISPHYAVYLTRTFASMCSSR